MDISTEAIAENYQEVRRRIEAAKRRGAHSAPAVQLIAVTKTHPAELVEAAYAAGMRTVGENRVQELQEKFERVQSPVEWHLIGHLQTNKVRFAVDKVAMIESLDRYELALEIEKRAAAIERVIPCLIQVNIAHDDSKFGMEAAAVMDFCRRVAALPHIEVRGLMTIAPFVDDEAVIRDCFAGLRELRDSLAAELAAAPLPNVRMEELSMGMSGDFEIAVEEGATMVRVGSALFGGRVYR